jgi:crotonobetainyl-CoA:carnitine CoA-transferase CaiB-like acyl-CoA transferase
MPETKDALSDVRVVEFGGYAAGPAIGKYLANFGARVVHVESEQRPDGFRLQYPPFKDDKVGINRSGCFSYFNDSKYGVTIDLKSDHGIAMALRLTDWADIVIENMRPGVMDRLGLGHQRLCDRNPELVMLSTSNMGQSGPYSTHPGFGSQLSSLSGFTELIGESDGPPNLLYGPYIDLIAVAYGGAAVLAALDCRRRTGKGVHIDLSQYETGVQFIAPALLDFAENGKIAHRNGNHDPAAVLHGCYPCRNSQWCVISCWNDDELQRFRAATGLRDLDNEAIAGWTSDQNARDVMNLLQGHGVHAACVNTMADLFSDPQLEARNIWQEMDHPEIGPQRYRMVAYQLSETPGRVRSGAPCLGEDNEEVLTRWLDLNEGVAVRRAATQRRK